MSNTPRIGPNSRDDELTQLLRSLYAPPGGDAYWETLESGIIARIAGEQDWASPFAGWIREGVLVAAVAIVAMAIGLLWSSQVNDAPDAYVTVIEVPRTLPQQLATETTGLPASEAALRFVIAP